MISFYEVYWHLLQFLCACLYSEEDPDTYWESYIRQSVGSLYHYAVTAKMAPDTDPLGVVNPPLD